MRWKALPVAMAAAALSALTVASATPATAATSATAMRTVQVRLQSVATIRESSGTWFSRSGNQVMTGRSHSGDENGYTEYRFGP